MPTYIIGSTKFHNNSTCHCIIAPFANNGTRLHILVHVTSGPILRYFKGNDNTLITTFVMSYPSTSKLLSHLELICTRTFISVPKSWLCNTTY